MKKFYLFLDIDGVLNNITWLKNCVDNNLEEKGYYRFIDPKCIDAINFLIDKLSEKFDVQVVISSLWKLQGHDYCTEILKKHNLKFKNDLDFTPTNFERNRFKEIYKYLTEKKQFNNFLVIDDEDLSELLNFNHFIKTTGYYNYGLTINQVENWLENLNKNTFSK